MLIRRWILVLLSATIALLVGCGGTKNVQNSPPPPPVSNVSVAFEPAPATSLFISGQTAVTAVVSNDPGNYGVDWLLTCQNAGNCGSLSSQHSDSSQAITYSSPQTLAGNSQSVTVLAFATADHTKNAVARITISAFAGTLNGTYVFQTKGTDAGFQPYQLAGVIVLDGNGGIKSGEQTLSNAAGALTTSIAQGSGYFVGTDGRGTLTLNTLDQTGQPVTENFSMVILSSSQALIAEDDPTQSSSGTMDLQTSTAAPTGGYAFSTGGTDVANASPTAWGGVLVIDSPNTISGAGTVVDQDLFGTVTNCPAPAFSGTVSAPDSFGMLKFDLTFDLNTCFVSTPTVQFTGYIVDGLRIVLVESDNAGLGTGGLTAGVAISQGSATGTFTSNNSFAGKYVFAVLGQDSSGIPSSFASLGRFAADQSGNLTGGFNNKYLGGLSTEVSGPFTGTYTLDPAGTGRVDSFVTFNDPSNPGAELIFYLTGNGHTPLVLDADGDVNFGPLAVATGLAYPQAAPPYTLNGKYGLNFTQSVSGNPNDATAEITVDGTAKSLSGIMDINLSFAANVGTQLTGTFGAIPNSGHFTGTLTNNFFPSAGTIPNTISVAYYLVDSGHGFFIETNSLSTGELSFGYFASRTPLCQGCP